MELEEAIQQEQIKDDRLRLGLNMYFTQSQLQYQSSLTLKPFGLSVQQYNILRILKGQNNKPISITDISQRMVDKMSNASRLVEKLRNKDLVHRTECPVDRRRVEIIATEKGIDLVTEATLKMDAAIQSQLAHLSDEEVQIINRILDKINQGSN